MMTEIQTTTPVFELKIREAKTHFLQVVQNENVFVREAMFAVQAIKGSRMLQQAEPDSIKQALINVALTGATLNPALQQAFLVPRGGKCCLDFSYRGLIKIATDSRSIKQINAQVVYTFDQFDYEQGDQPFVRYKQALIPPAEFLDAPSNFWDYVLCSYSIAVLFDGAKDICILPKWKLEKAMRTSKTHSDDSPWRTHPDEMCRKTQLKYHYKTLPQTDRMSEAVSILNEHEGLDPDKKLGGAGNRIMERFRTVPEHDDHAESQVADTEIPHEAQEGPKGPTMVERYGKLLSAARDLPEVRKTWNLIAKAKDVTQKEREELHRIFTAVETGLEGKKDNAPDAREIF